MSVRGKTVVVFGAAAGLGRGIAQEFVEHGSRMYLADRDADALRRTTRDLSERVAGVEGSVSCDITDHEAVTAAAQAALALMGSIDIMVNAAGITRFAAFTEITPADWQALIDVNLTGAFFCSQAAARVMLNQPGGCIVNVASQAGFRGQPHNAHYGAAKAGLLHLTRTMALELAPTVRVNAICPGEIATAMMDTTFAYFHARDGRTPSEQRDALRGSIPLGRFQTPASIASAVRFLCSDDAADITGQALVVDGGILA